MKSFRIALISFVIATSTISFADHASAAATLSQDFKSGLYDT